MEEIERVLRPFARLKDVGSFYLSVLSSNRDIGAGTTEDEALRRGCTGAWLDTFSFQAPDFHRRRGYMMFGAIGITRKAIPATSSRNP